jgi:hypothetical protein
MTRRSGITATAVTGASSVNRHSTFPLSTSHTRNVRSSEPETTRRLSNTATTVHGTIGTVPHTPAAARIGTATVPQPAATVCDGNATASVVSAAPRQPVGTVRGPVSGTREPSQPFVSNRLCPTDGYGAYVPWDVVHRERGAVGEMEEQAAGALQNRLPSVILGPGGAPGLLPMLRPGLAWTALREVIGRW